MDPNIQRDLKIKAGVLKRYLQEVEYYRKEVQKQTDKVNALKTEETTTDQQYIVKKAVEVLQENQQMVSLSSQNAKKAAIELKSLTNEWTTTENDVRADQSEQKTAVRELLDRAEQLSL